MQEQSGRPFETLESALAFMHLLTSEIEETRTDVQHDIADIQPGTDRRHAEALQLVDYKLQQLALHVGKSEKLLRDLARLRTLIMDGSHMTARAAVSVDR